MLWEQSEDEKVAVIKAEGERRGLPVLVPVGDFDDVVNVSPPDIWGGFVNPLSDVSERYNPDGVVLLKIRRNRVDWQLYPKFQDMKYSAPIEGSDTGDINGVLANVVDAIADQYASRTAVTLGGDASNTTLLSITGLQSSEDYFSLERTLEGLNSIASLKLQSLSQGEAIFQISLLGTEEVFNNELMVDRRISKGSAETEIVDGRVVPLKLNYRFRGVSKVPAPAPRAPEAETPDNEEPSASEDITESENTVEQAVQSTANVGSDSEQEQN